MLIVGQGLHDVSFAAHPIKGAFTPLSSQRSIERLPSFNESWALFNFLLRCDAQCHCVNSLRNPNKAICTIEARTTKVRINLALNL